MSRIQRIEVPSDLAAVVSNPEELRRLLEFVRANEHLSFICDGKTAPLSLSDENAIVDLSKIIPRFALPGQSAVTDGLYLMSNGSDGSESWEILEQMLGLFVTGSNDQYNYGDGT